MVSTLIALISLLLFALPTFAKIEIYSGFLIGSAKMDETQSGNSYTHTNTFFVGHFGIGAGTRIKLEIDNFSFGVLGELDWLGDSFDRKQTGVVNDATYRYESTRLMSGLTSTLRFGYFGIIGEYYPWVQNTVTYSDEKTENPFRKNDKLKATGYGLGFNIEFGNSGFAYSTVYRRLTYSDVEMSGAQVSLPSGQYSSMVLDDIMASLRFSY